MKLIMAKKGFETAIVRRMRRAELARKVNVSSATIYYIASGKRGVSAPIANRIANELNMSFDDLFLITDSENINKR